MNERLNLTVDSEIKEMARIKAKEIGLSLSALTGLLLSQWLNKNKLSGVEQGLLDYINGDVEKVSYKDFKKELQDMIDA